MSQPFIGEIRMFGFDFPPRGWALCNGQTLSIAQNAALFSILGTTYGGNGTTTFQLPNMQSRIPYNWGQGPGLSNYSLGQVGGEENHTLLTSEIPLHNHLVNAVNAASNVPGAAGNKWCQNNNAYGTPLNGVVPASDIGFTGGSQPHANLAPYLVVSFCIALVGTFPSRN